MSVNACQFCGKQTTTLEAYFRWMVCSGCAVTLRADSSSTEGPRQRSTKRARCNVCRNLKERETLHKFIELNPIDSPINYRGKLVCQACNQFLQASCRTCGRVSIARHGSAIDYQCPSCYHKHQAQQERNWGENWVNQYHKRQNAPQAARQLAEYAGERLEWPCAPEELKRVWRSAARRTHPDTGGSSEAFREAKACYDALAEVAR